MGLRTRSAGSSKKKGRETPEDWVQWVVDATAENNGVAVAYREGTRHSPEVRRHLLHTSHIIVHSEKNGTGRRTRHVFTRGEIVFRDGANIGESNPH